MTGWKVKEAENHIQCSLCQIPMIYVEQLVKQKIEVLLNTYPHNEWTSYLVGHISEKGNVFVEDLIVPPHAYTPTMGSAEVAPPEYNEKTGKYKFHIPDNCVGFLHSHDSLGAFHSGTDDAHVDKNYAVSITVAKRVGSLEVEYDAVSYTVTPCGKATIGKPVIKYVAPKPLFNVEKWLEEAKKNIERVREKKETYIPASGENIRQLPTKELISNGKGKMLKKSKIAGSSDDIFTDENGRVMSKKEVEELLKGKF